MMKNAGSVIMKGIMSPFRFVGKLFGAFAEGANAENYRKQLVDTTDLIKSDISELKENLIEKVTNNENYLKSISENIQAIFDIQDKQYKDKIAEFDETPKQNDGKGFFSSLLGLGKNFLLNPMGAITSLFSSIKVFGTWAMRILKPIWIVIGIVKAIFSFFEGASNTEGNFVDKLGGRTKSNDD